MMGLWITSDSSMIEQYRYDSGEQILEVKIRSKGGTKTYRYFGIDEDTFNGFKGADSPGTYFNEHIRHRDFERV